MIKDFKAEELKQFNALVSLYEQNIKLIEGNLAVIDEKYRKLAEAEKAADTEKLNYCKAQLVMFKDLVAPKSADNASSQETEEALIDTVFPENNEDEGPEFDGAGFTELDRGPEPAYQESMEDLIAPADEEDMPEEIADPLPVNDLDAEEDADWDEMISTGEIIPVQADDAKDEDKEDEDEWPDVTEEW